MNPAEIRTEITAKIIEALQQDRIPWRRPWTLDGNCGPSRNIVSKRLYRGINPMLLELASMGHGYTSRWWATYRQWQELGGQVRRGEKATRIVFYSVVEKERHDAEAEEDRIERLFILRDYCLFNLDQVYGHDLDRFRPAQADGQVAALANWEPADKAVAATGADIRYGGNRAFYSPAGDFIQVPSRQQFTDLRDWYGVHFHELGHWSAPRLGTKGDYAFGELVAELAAAFVSWQLNVPQSEDLTNHQAYLATWLKAMQNDPRWVLQASSQASKAADFVLSFSQQAQPQPEAAEAA